MVGVHDIRTGGSGISLIVSQSIEIPVLVEHPLGSAVVDESVVDGRNRAFVQSLGSQHTLVVLLEAVTEEAITKSPLVPLLFPPPGTSVSVQDVNAVPAIAEVRRRLIKDSFSCCFVLLYYTNRY